MRLLSRIKNLEAAAPKPPGPCPCCGAIDPVALCGLMRGGIFVRNWDLERGRELVYCNRCRRKFTCLVRRQEGNAVWVREVVFDPPSRYPPRTDDEQV